jgi:alkanesulfonate monooxygenase SsuD/methylene tetrahydromethanopterin reductase-like flavin-dependent oxidoreductase (luciferase family)
VALRFGVVVRAEASAVRRVEQAGFDSVWCGGHVASRNPSPETMVQLARLSALAERAVVGTAVLPLPLYPPAVIAKQAADLDVATGGRLILGVGIGGEYAQEFRACEVPLAERGGRTNESIALLREFWSGQPVSFTGRYHQISDVLIQPPPVTPGGPPIVVAGRQEAAMRRAALLGDGWMPYLYSPRRYARSVETIAGLAASSGRDLAGFHWCAFLFTNVHADGEAARDEAAEFLGGSYRQDFRAMLESVAAAGTVPEVRAKVQAFADAGARHIIITPASRTRSLEIAETVAREIAPSISVPAPLRPYPARRDSIVMGRGRARRRHGSPPASL